MSEADEEFESCSSVELDYAPPRPEDEEPGWHSYGPFLQISFTAGDVVVDVDTTLPKDQAVATLATLAPLDLASQPVERVSISAVSGR